jgi:protein-S-isoprenylcysteine O-methyltransferase Ste14
MRSRPGLVLVIAQFGAIGALLVYAWRGLVACPGLLVGAGLSAVVMISAVIAMRPAHVRVGPEPKQGSPLCTRGIYRWIRHPMYSALLLLGASLALGRPDLVAGGLFAALAIVLVLKLRLEENLWLQHSPEYADYMQRSKRLIPWVY